MPGTDDPQGDEGVGSIGVESALPGLTPDVRYAARPSLGRESSKRVGGHREFMLFQPDPVLNPRPRSLGKRIFTSSPEPGGQSPRSRPACRAQRVRVAKR